MRERPVHAAVGLVLAAVLLRGALDPGVRLGVATSEAPGRVFVSAQVWRWMRGDAAPGWADLLAWPEGRPFWPVDPLVQLFEAPLQAWLGPDPAFTVMVGGLLALGSFAAIRLARAEGAGPASAVLAGAALTLSPTLLRNLRDAVTEALAVGLAAVAVGASLHAVRRPGARSAALAGLAVLGLGMISPYLAVYLAVGWALALPFFLRTHAAGLGRLAVAGALACAVAAAPLLWAEGDAGGRLGPEWTGGYHLDPAPLEYAGGDRARLPPPRGREATAAGASLVGSRVPPPLERSLRRIPGGAALLVLCVGALLHGRARPWAALALAFWALGPAPGLAMRALGGGGLPPPPLLPRLLEMLPLTGAMGNPERMLGAWALLAAIAGAIALRGRPVWLTGAAALVLLTGELEQPRLRAPATRDPVPARVLSAAHGPMMVFPSGDPPAWHPSVSPKEALALAARADQPVAHDYGRGGTPADLPGLVRLAAIGGVPLGATAWPAARPPPTDDGVWAGLPFTHVLLLEDRLDLQQRQHIRDWLAPRAPLLAEAPGVSLWGWPAPATTPPPPR